MITQTCDFFNQTYSSMIWTDELSSQHRYKFINTSKKVLEATRYFFSTIIVV